MKVPWSWLTEYCDPGLPVEDVVRQLALSGTEVERVTRVGIPFGDGNAALFRVGRVTAVEAHPNADRLKICSVQLASADTRSIVCGAPNVAAGELVLVALPGAVLPDGRALERATLRGVRSEGMILSESEIEIGADAEGIMVLPDSFEAGEEATRYVPLGDDVLELEVNPNRPDCLAVYGVARELQAVTGVPLAPDPAGEEPPELGERSAETQLAVSVDDPALCPRFSVRVFTDVSVSTSPLWLKARLIAAGQRPINNVVDITNYVMLLLGQPMHAYDLDRLAGPVLHVRCAREGERLQTLDGEDRCFDGDAVLVCDRDGSVGIGGIMGGATSEVSQRTTTVAIEAATWNGPNILKTSSKLGLRTEASARFEKQLHPDLALEAQRLAARLMVDLCGARVAPGLIDVAAALEPPPPIKLRSSRIERLLGQRVEPGESKVILGRLGFGVTEEGADLTVNVPHFRQSDVSREADLIEEVARVRGLDKLPATLPTRGKAVGGLTQDQKWRRLAEDMLRARGLSEVVTNAFFGPDVLDRFLLPESDVRLRALRIANPLSEDQSVMRTMLLPGLLQVTARNLARDERELRLFESGRIFIANGSERQPQEKLHLAVLLAGTYLPKTWRSEALKPDFHVVKALLSGLLEALRVNWRLVGGGPAFLHPGRAAEVLVGAQEAGWLGELHPVVARSFGLDGLERSPALLELDLDVVLAGAGGPAGYEDLITYPAVFQDIAVIVDEAVEAQTVIETVRAAGGEHLRVAQVFDLYRGKQLGEGEKSLALRLEFRAPDRTLTDEEVAEHRERIREAVSRELDGRLRE